MNPFSRCFRINVANSAQFRGEPGPEDGFLLLANVGTSVGDGFWVRITGITGDGMASDAFRGRNTSGDADRIEAFGLLAIVDCFRELARDSYVSILAAKLTLAKLIMRHTTC